MHSKSHLHKLGYFSGAIACEQRLLVTFLISTFLSAVPLECLLEEPHCHNDMRKHPERLLLEKEEEKKELQPFIRLDSLNMCKTCFIFRRDFGSCKGQYPTKTRKQSVQAKTIIEEKIESGRLISPSGKATRM